MTGPAELDEEFDDLDEPYSITEREAEEDAEQQSLYGDPIEMDRVEAAANGLRDLCSPRAVSEGWPALRGVLIALADALDESARTHRDRGQNPSRVKGTLRATLEAVERLTS